MLLAATAMMATFGAAGAVGTAAPALADDPGMWCIYSASGTVTAPSTAQYGQLVTVQWNVNTPVCDTGLVAFVDGPGFNGTNEDLPLGGSRAVRAVTDGTTITWRLYVMDLDADSPYPIQLASTTMTVP